MFEAAGNFTIFFNCTGRKKLHIEFKNQIVEMSEKFLLMCVVVVKL